MTQEQPTDRQRTTLRTLIPTFEVEWAMPIVLLLVIMGAAVGETWVIGVSVTELYRLGVGWVIGGVVALVQMLGSMIWSRNAQHNTTRYIRRGWQTNPKDPKGEKVFVENVKRSEPRLNIWQPALASVIAGVISAWLAGALYSQDGTLSALDLALSLAAPLGSSGAALLNSVFAHGEIALADWQAEQTATGRTTRKRARTGEATAPPASHAVRPLAEDGRQTARTQRPLAEREVVHSEALAGHLADLRKRLADKAQTDGQDNSQFRRQDVQDMLGLGLTHAKNVLAYGRQLGLVETVTRDTYRFKIAEPSEP